MTSHRVAATSTVQEYNGRRSSDNASSPQNRGKRLKSHALLPSTLLLSLVCFSVAVSISEAATATDRRDFSNPAPQGIGGKSRPVKAMHSQFTNAGQKTGLEIWRVENFEPVLVPAKDHGKFYTGDSYVVLNTEELKKGNFAWDIHFWLGLETSQDESGTAAILTVELDDILGGAPVQHREVQEHESQKFLSYFKGGIRYLPGGVASGFKHVDPNAFEKRLFQVKGKRNVRVRQVEPSVSAMNKGDCFILDVGKDVYVYVGKDAKRAERLKAISAANQIRDQDHGGRSKIHIIDEFSREEEVQEFFKALGTGNPTSVPDGNTSDDDQVYENKQEDIALYRVSDASGSTKYEKVNEKPLKQSSLNTNDCFYLDTAGSGIYVWIGKKCSERERKDALTKAQEYVKTKKYPAWMPVQRIVEHGEPAAFKQFFPGWRDQGELHSRLMKRSINLSKEEDHKLIKALEKGGGRAQSFMPDKGDGTVEIYRIENFEAVPVDPKIYGMFFGGDSYVIKYKYHTSHGDKYIIYYWQGKASTQDERECSALIAIRMDMELGGRAMQIRVVQDYEPSHFLQIFKGKMITLLGGKASGFKNLKDHDTYDVDGTRLFRIRGTNANNVRASQQPEVATSLNSDDVFLLETPGMAYIWKGAGSNKNELTMAQNIAKRLITSTPVVQINEGDETEDFWTALGGQANYEKSFTETTIESPRLFHCHLTKRGNLKVEEIHKYTQEDLNEDDIMVMDSGDEIYIWVGNFASVEEKKMVGQLAKQYLKKHAHERGVAQDVLITIKQGDEPESFKSLFPAWDPAMWEAQLSYDEIKKQVLDANNIIVD